MKEIVSYAYGHFNDYLGKEHHITVCGITEKVEDGYLELCNEYGDEIDGEEFDVEKTLRIGFAICNPVDIYDSDKGEILSYNRAKSWNSIILSTSRSGMFNTATVNFFLTDFLNYIKRSPHSFIKGYKEAELKYRERIDLLDDIRKMSNNEIENMKALASATPKNIEYAKKIVKLLQ